jgi:phosphohistidine phosphatase SixA
VSVVLLRHASAGDRREWQGDDLLRPLDDRGRRQALVLRELAGRGIVRIVSSPYVRCVETVEPLATTLGLAIDVDARLAEGADPHDALALLVDLDAGVACTHGDVIEALLGHSLKKGAGAVVEPDEDGLRVLEELPKPHGF